MQRFAGALRRFEIFAAVISKPEIQALSNRRLPDDVGVPLDLPQTQAKSLEQDKTPLQLSVNVKGQIYINDTEVAFNDLIPKLKAITDARGGLDERIFMRADKKADYGTVAKVMGLLSSAGFKRLALVTEVDQGT